MRRRDLITTGLAAPLAMAWAPGDGFATTVRRRARTLAASPYRAPTRPLPAALANITYDAYRDLRFRPDRAIWHDRPFELQLFHRGGLFRDPVDLFEVERGAARPIAFSQDLFNYGPQKIGQLPADLGYAGFRIHSAVQSDYRDEVAAFLGASYFRAVAKGVNYGLSARGLALGAGEPGEEFPAFRAFWIERPAPGARSIVLHALLDSPSVAGAYRFDISTGEATVMDITAELFPRRRLTSAGIAPLTSMYLFGPEQPRRYDDFRPQVHDSDGLLTDDGQGNRVWRPLVHSGVTRLTDLDAGPARGFGLLQRQRDFAAYQDLEANYHLRPGAWIEPLEGFGRGAVRLVELGARSEAEDNIVAMWRPAAPLEPRRAHRFRYRLTWAASPEPRTPLARALAWRDGRSESGRRRFIVDFAGLSGGMEGLSVQLSATAGSSRLESVQPNASIGGARVSFEFDPAGAATSGLRATLVRGRTPVSEVWMYRWLA